MYNKKLVNTLFLSSQRLEEVWGNVGRLQVNERVEVKRIWRELRENAGHVASWGYFRAGGRFGEDTGLRKRKEEIEVWKGGC